MTSILEESEANRYFDLLKALEEFHKLFTCTETDDRAIAVLGGTFLEMVLEHILYAFLPENEKEVERLTEHNQPLGNFSNKIAMAYCLGLIEKIVKEDLNCIRKIRNEFAHNLYASFESDKVKSWCYQLKWHKIALVRDPPEDATVRDYFQVGTNTLISHLHGCVGLARGEKRKIRSNW
jgi:hypothetical protein